MILDEVDSEHVDASISARILYGLIECDGCFGERIKSSDLYSRVVTHLVTEFQHRSDQQPEWESLLESKITNDPALCDM
ncbi:MAG: hypothetical protein WA823_02165 [Candidatus Acidiferrales bacterium]